MSVSSGGPAIAYICDRGVPECKGKCTEDYLCVNTFDPTHALFGECKHPEEHPERFELWKSGDKEIWWEK